MSLKNFISTLSNLRDELKRENSPIRSRSQFFSSGGNVDNRRREKVKQLAAKGRFGDTQLAEIGPETSRTLDYLIHGGHKHINPRTGLKEYHTKFWNTRKKKTKKLTAIKRQQRREELGMRREELETNKINRQRLKKRFKKKPDNEQFAIWDQLANDEAYSSGEEGGFSKGIIPGSQKTDQRKNFKIKHTGRLSSKFDNPEFLNKDQLHRYMIEKGIEKTVQRGALEGRKQPVATSTIFMTPRGRKKVKAEIIKHKEALKEKAGKVGQNHPLPIGFRGVFATHPMFNAPINVPGPRSRMGYHTGRDMQALVAADPSDKENKNRVRLSHLDSIVGGVRYQPPESKNK